jgi:hypothetical protein
MCKNKTMRKSNDLAMRKAEVPQCLVTWVWLLSRARQIFQFFYASLGCEPWTNICLGDNFFCTLRYSWHTNSNDDCSVFRVCRHLFPTPTPVSLPSFSDLHMCGVEQQTKNNETLSKLQPLDKSLRFCFFSILSLYLLFIVCVVSFFWWNKAAASMT